MPKYTLIAATLIATSALAFAEDCEFFPALDPVKSKIEASSFDCYQDVSNGTNVRHYIASQSEQVTTASTGNRFDVCRAQGGNAMTFRRFDHGFEQRVNIGFNTWEFKPIEIAGMNCLHAVSKRSRSRVESVYHCDPNKAEAFTAQEFRSWMLDPASVPQEAIGSETFFVSSNMTAIDGYADAMNMCGVKADEPSSEYGYNGGGQQDTITTCPPSCYLVVF